MPGLDDGSRDSAMTEVMLKAEAEQGVSLVVATPHFYAERVSMDGFLRSRAHALQKAEAVRQRSGTPLPRLITGAEVYYFAGIGQANGIEKLCIGETKVFLLECPFEQWTESLFRDVKALVEKKGLQVVLAHVERYPSFQKDKTVWNRVFQLPVIPQLNAGSFTKKAGLFHRDQTRRFCLDFLQSHPQTILGTDCHNTTSRPPNLARARQEITEALSRETLARMDETLRQLLK